MTDRTIHLPVAAQPTVDTYVELAQRGEALGYRRAWLPETWGRDAVTILTRIAAETTDIGIGPSVCNVFSRSPTLIAQTAVTLQAVADGRLRLGIGPSGPAVIEHWHGVDFDRPLRRTREYVEIINKALTGEPVQYDGNVLSLSGFRLRCDPPDDPVPIDVAGMGPKSVELAGRFADGWHAMTVTPDGLETRLADFARGASLAGRDPDTLRVTLSVPACALEDGKRARDLARQHVAFYVGGMGTYYRDSLSRQGYEEEAMSIADAWQTGETERAAALVDDGLLDELTAAGTPEHALAQLERFESVSGLDRVAIGFPRGASRPEIEATLETLAPN